MQDRIEPLMRELTDEMSRGYRAFSAAAGINMSDMMAIRFVRDQEGQATPTALGRYLGMTSGATAILINRLEKDAYVLREQHPNDRRATLLRVGPGAEDMALPLSRSAQRLRETVMAGYSRSDIEVIERFLSDIVAALKLRNEGLEAELATKTTDRHPRA
ncbi:MULTISPECIES: MarR family winged helix-turn-helix transcriptional regulator [unclassified Devosia]|uniref:MarR family winged helix-turn-helix transcriptional regulator n=1 Tax=unclassified Devosia TaxID=196773 RepID=UPI0025DD77B3|nr:MarR family transcriptional regulator [Devosia sp.]MCR6635757.1 MarR family transcriptional regulator [Devosia sp.]